MISVNSKVAQLSVFCIALLAAISPILLNKFFPTVDGPAHLYNAHILRELIFGDDEFYSRFFNYNSFPVPNWTGHAIAIVTGFFLPVWMVEKVIILLIVCGLPLSIVYMSKAYGAVTSWHLLLVLPFTYTLTLYLGFFNFMIALPLMFVWIGILKRDKFKTDKKGFIFMTLFLCLIYFSHLLVFMLTLGFTFLEIIRSIYINRFFSSSSKRPFIIISCFAPGLLLSVLFFMGRGVEGFRKSVDVLPVSELWNRIKYGSPLVGLNGEIENPITSVFMFGIIILLAGIYIFRIIKKTGSQSADMLLVFACCMLILYFIVPDGIASGGFVSIRLLLLVMIFITAWILTSKLPLPVSIIVGLLGIFTSFSTLAYRHQVTSQLNSDAQNIIAAAESLNPGSVLLPLNYSNNWLHINISNYIGADRDIIVLDNYEAVLNEFPLEWKKDKAPGTLAGNFTQSLNPEISIENYEVQTGEKINYVARWRFNNDERDSLKTETNNKLMVIFGEPLKVGNCEIFDNDGE